MENNATIKEEKKSSFTPFQSGTRRFGQSKDEFDSKLLDLARVTRVTAGGKHLRFRAVVAVGNKLGKIGLGVAKGLDVSQAVEKATRAAKKNTITIPTANETILFETFAKFGPAKILLRPQKKGRGLIAGGVVRIICELAGIKNISSKILGRTTNKLNNAKATIDALEKTLRSKTKISDRVDKEQDKTGAENIPV